MKIIFLNTSEKTGAHQLEPLSPLISGVNPFPSRFINRTARFPEKCHTSVSFVCRREKVLLLLLLLLYILQSLGSGYHVIKVNKLPDALRVKTDS